MFTPEEGKTLGPYTLIRFLGKGTFKQVWLAKWNTIPPRNVAVGIITDSEVNVASVEKEAALWLQVRDDPNVLGFIEANRYEGVLVVVSEYADGGSLKDWLKEKGGKAASEREAVEMMIPILKGLQYLHTQPRPIVHRDLKPGNVLLDKSVPKIADFGISKALQTVNTKESAGTPAYMAPEMCKGKYDPRSDVWGVGIMLYEFLSGKRPFSGENNVDIGLKIISEPHPPLPATISPSLRTIVDIALQKEPNNRYQSAREMRKALESYLVPAPARTVVPQAQPIPPRPVVTPAPTLSRSNPKPSQWDALTSRRAMLGGCFATIVAGFGGKYVYDMATKPVFIPSPSTTTNPKDGSEMITVPAGKFIMGSDDSDSDAESDEKPQRKVYLSAYKISKYEVTVAQFRKFVKATGRKFDWNGCKPEWGWIDNHPMVMVAWDEARAFCQWVGGDLPTEAQWEKAARSTDGRKYPWGNNWDAKKCRCSLKEVGDSGGKISVGSYPQGVSPYGVHDMVGNVWEWCKDYYDENYYKNAPSNNPENLKKSSRRVLRGGSWSDSGVLGFRSADRNGGNDWFVNLGFRVVVQDS